MSRTGTLAMVALSLLLLAATNESPVGWRSNGTGHYTGVTPPTEWAEDRDVVWKIDLPGRSQGSPIVVGERIFVVSDPAELLSINAATGEIEWRRSSGLEELLGNDKAREVMAEFKRLRDARQATERELGKAKGDAEKEQELKHQLEANQREMTKLTAQYPAPPSFANGEATNSAPTPASDGTLVYASFGNGVVTAYTLDGKRRWIKYLEAPTIGFGHCSSPVLADGKLIVHLNDLVALDKSSGEIVWRTPLAPRHASPVVASVGQTRVVVSPAGAIVRLDDGSLLVKNGRFGSSESSPVVEGDMLYATPDGSATAMRLVPEGSSVKLETLWTRKIAGGRRTPSPVLHKGLLYTVNTDGILEALDAATGQPAFKDRLNIGSVYSSATAADDQLYFSGASGTTVVLASGPEYRELARNKLEGFGSSPVFSGRRMYVRTRQHLYCIGE